MKCHRAQHYMMAYHDGELSAGTKRRVRKHLESCSECARLLEGLRLADRQACSAAGGTEMVNVPPPDDRYWESFTPRVLDSIEEDAASRIPERIPHQGRRWDNMVPRLVPAFSVAIVVLVAAGLIIMKTGNHPAEPGTGMVASRPSTGENGPVAEVREPQIVLKDASGGTDTDTLKSSSGKGQPPQGHVRESHEEGPSARVEPAAGQQVAVQKKPAPSAKKREARDDSRETVRAVDKSAPAVKPPADGIAPSREKQQKTVGQGVVAAKVLSPQEKNLNRETAGGTKSAAESAVKGSARTREAAAVEARGLSAKAETITAGEGGGGQEPSGRSPEVEGTGTEPQLSAVSSTIPEEPGAEANSGAPAVSSEPTQDIGEPAAGAGVIEAMGQSESAVQGRASSAQHYQSPENQLVHAKDLAGEMEFRESEKVLRDLISRDPPSPVLEEASILLVKVLKSQNRLDEAREVLDKAKAQFPSSEPIQKFDLEGMGNDSRE